MEEVGQILLLDLMSHLPHSLTVTQSKNYYLEVNPISYAGRAKGCFSLPVILPKKSSFSPPKNLRDEHKTWSGGLAKDYLKPGAGVYVLKCEFIQPEYFVHSICSSYIHMFAACSYYIS